MQGLGTYIIPGALSDGVCFRFICRDIMYIVLYFISWERRVEYIIIIIIIIIIIRNHTDFYDIEIGETAAFKLHLLLPTRRRRCLNVDNHAVQIAVCIPQSVRHQRLRRPQRVLQQANVNILMELLLLGVYQ